MSGVDFIEEIRIAQFWRQQLGEYEYVYYNPDDLRRWFIALELRGPDEVRQYLTERTGRYPPGQVTGIVSQAPHPPLPIVELWLASHNAARTGSWWMALGLFVLVCYIFIPQLHSCTQLYNVDRYATHPPTMGAPLQAGAPAPVVPQAPATMPVQAPPGPASTASPSATPPAGGRPH